MTADEMTALWEEHQSAEFERRDVDATLATMSDDPHILNVPVMVGGRGRDGVARFYREVFIPGIPADIEVVDFSATVGERRIVAERNMAFTHDRVMPWILPGVEPTNRRVEVPHVVIVDFARGKVHSEHIYWDQGSVLLQAGLIEAGPDLPLVGAAQASELAEMARNG